MTIENIISAGGKVKFDPTINLGHVLTFIGFLVAIFTAWVSLDKRVVILEQGFTKQIVIDQHQDRIVDTKITVFKESLDDIKKSIERLSNLMETRK